MLKSKVNTALQLAGNQHKYQWILVALIAFSWTALNFVLLGSTFIFIEPVFHCDGNYDKKIFEKEACQKIERCQLVENFTLTADLSLFCENEWVRNMTQSVFNIGCMLGLFVMNMMSDTKSRKFALKISILFAVLGLLTILMGGYIKYIPVVIVGQLLQGFGAASILPLSYAFLTDYCSEKFKPRAVIIVNMAWSVSTVLLGVFYLVEMKWSTYVLYLTAGPLIVSFALFEVFLLQSPHILNLRNKKKQAIQVLQRVAKINNRTQNIQKINQIINQAHQTNTNNKQSLKSVIRLLREWQYLLPIIILSVLRMVGTLNFYGSSYAFGVEGLGLGYNSMIAGFLEVASFLFLTVFVNKIPRRKGIAGFFSIVFLIGMMFWFDFVKDNLILGTLLLGTSRIFSTISYTLIASVQTQAFTNQIQSTAVGITEVFALIGAAFSPLVVDLGDKIGIDPVVLISILLNFGIWPNIFLKQTLKRQKSQQKQPLMDSITETDFRDSLLSQNSPSDQVISIDKMAEQGQ